MCVMHGRFWPCNCCNICERTGRGDTHRHYHHHHHHPSRAHAYMVIQAVCLTQSTHFQQQHIAVRWKTKKNIKGRLVELQGEMGRFTTLCGANPGEEPRFKICGGGKKFWGDFVWKLKKLGGERGMFTPPSGADPGFKICGGKNFWGDFWKLKKFEGEGVFSSPLQGRSPDS